MDKTTFPADALALTTSAPVVSVAKRYLEAKLRLTKKRLWANCRRLAINTDYNGTTLADEGSEETGWQASSDCVDSDEAAGKSGRLM